jgi:hypothetical protein
MVGALFLDRVLRGDAVDLTVRDVPPGKVDHMLAVLGLYHVRVRFVIPEESGGQYKREVSAMASTCRLKFLLMRSVVAFTDILVRDG